MFNVAHNVKHTFQDHSLEALLTVNYFSVRVRHRANGEQMTLGCLKMAPCGARHLLIHTSMGLMMMVMKRRKKKNPARKAA